MVFRCALLNSSPVSIIGRLRVGDKTMSVSEQVRPLLAARAAKDPCAARLLEMFDKANELLERSPYKYRDVEIFNSQGPKRSSKRMGYEEIC
jgi:hypothetical protein